MPLHFRKWVKESVQRGADVPRFKRGGEAADPGLGEQALRQRLDLQFRVLDSNPLRLGGQAIDDRMNGDIVVIGFGVGPAAISSFEPKSAEEPRANGAVLIFE